MTDNNGCCYSAEEAEVMAIAGRLRSEDVNLIDSSTRTCSHETMASQMSALDGLLPEVRHNDLYHTKTRAQDAFSQEL